MRKSVQIPLAVDESSVSPADFFAHAAEGLVDYLVKVTRSGGVWPTLTQISVAEAAGLPLLVSGLTDGLLTKLAVCQVAAAFGCVGPAALNGSQFTDESALFPIKADVESGGTIYLTDAPGIGVRPDEEALRDLLPYEGGALMRLTHAVGEALELRQGRDLLFRYVYESGVDPEESPKSYFHPLRTLTGEEVTLFRPHDHPWHTGLAMTSAYLSGENFWGGPTFVRNRGYAWLENQGRIRHQVWKEIQSDASSIKELLFWSSHEEEAWIEEERGISVGR